MSNPVVIVEPTNCAHISGLLFLFACISGTGCVNGPRFRECNLFFLAVPVAVPSSATKVNLP